MITVILKNESALDVFLKTSLDMSKVYYAKKFNNSDKLFEIFEKNMDNVGIFEVYI